MKALFLLFILLMFVLWFGNKAHAYTMMINIREDRIDIQRPVEVDRGGLAQQDVNIAIRAQGLNGAPWRLQILAISDMLGPEPIPTSAFSWQAFNPQFINGQLAKGVPQILAQGTGDIDTVGKVRFKFLADNYDAGDYFSTLKFILSSP
jgi:hypothetical protein